MFALINRLFDTNVRDVNQLRRSVVEEVNRLEEATSGIQDLAAEFLKLREAVQSGEKGLDEVLVPAFALAREAAKRTIGKRPYDVQLVGAAALHQGRISEMKTGEGKTLVAAVAMALNALEGRGCHLVTVNDYLARVGAEEMGLVLRALGLTVGLIQHDLQPPDRQAAYRCDVTYVTNSELGFDYLRDNMAQSADQLVLRADHPLNFAIVDEVDSILIDEARTPLIISGPAERATDQYYVMAKLVKRLNQGEPAEPGVRSEPTGDYTLDEKSKAVHLTEQGIVRIEKLLSIDNLFGPENMERAHMIVQALRAKDLYHRNKDYIVNEQGEVVIVDEFTGRMMPGRRYGEGLHQAIEAKEGVKIENENQTLATITYQNFFRLYHKFAGMTGTAKTEEKEFLDIYGSDVLVVPTNLPVIRKDLEDQVYRSRDGKLYAVVDEIVERHLQGQPMLVGTVSIEGSERLSALLSQPSAFLPAVQSAYEGLKKALGRGNQETLDALEAWAEKLVELTPEQVEALGQLPKAAQEAQARLLRRARSLQAIRQGIPHQVLNAKYHQQEASIVAQAGRSGTVTIATNMAGRGTDIMLGGNAEFLAGELLEGVGLSRFDPAVENFTKALLRKDSEVRELGRQLPGLDDALIERLVAMREEVERDRAKVKELGGLHIIGTERHESRRIDNQLRGRSGRQGDPGSSRFYVSFEDELMRLFANERVVGMLDRMGMDDSQPIEARMVTGAIERAQARVEDRNFSIRKQLLEFDNVMSGQREVIYAQRREMLLGSDEEIAASIEGMIRDHLEVLVDRHIVGEEPDLEAFRTELLDAIPQLESLSEGELSGKSRDEVLDLVLAKSADLLDARRQEFGPETFQAASRFILLQLVDQAWKEHLHGMDILRQGIGLRGYGQRDPFTEYKFEGTNMFNEMIDALKADVTRYTFRMQLNPRAA
jgi:preprotein translocase subunit SecA